MNGSGGPSFSVLGGNQGSSGPGGACSRLLAFSLNNGQMSFPAFEFGVLLCGIMGMILLVGHANSQKFETYVPIPGAASLLSLFLLLVLTFFQVLSRVYLVARTVLFIGLVAAMGGWTMTAVGFTLYMSGGRGLPFLPDVYLQRLVAGWVGYTLVAALPFLVDRGSTIGLVFAELLVTAWFVGAWLWRYTKWSRSGPRRAGRVWLRYQLGVHALLTLNCVLSHVAKPEEWLEVSVCSRVASLLLTFVPYAGVLYVAMRVEEREWRSQHSLLLAAGNAARDGGRRSTFTATLSSRRARTLSLPPGLKSIRAADLIRTSTLSESSTVVVSRGLWHRNDVVIKSLTTAGTAEEQYERAAALIREATFLANLRHPNVVTLLGASLEPLPSLILEFMDIGSLKDLIQLASTGHHPRFEEYKMDKESGVMAPFLHKVEVRAKVLSDACRGAVFLHSLSPPVILKDLRSSGILVNARWQGKLSDFGEAREGFATNHNTRMATPTYLAPEILNGARYSAASDVYAFGVVAWETACLIPAYQDMSSLEIAQVVREGSRPAIPARLPQKLKNVIEACWSEEVQLRPTFEVVLKELSSLQLVVGDQSGEADMHSQHVP